MASVVEICNRGLQKLGEKLITSLEQDTPTARACKLAYPVLRDAELRAHPWNFAIKRTTLAADSVAPTWGRAASFQLPADFLRLLGPYPEDNTFEQDYQIEGNKIVTNQAGSAGTLQLRYIARIEDPNLMDVLFREALSARLALELCEKVTQSNTKLQSIAGMYKETISEARRANAIESRPVEAVMDSWISSRW